MNMKELKCRFVIFFSIAFVLFLFLSLSGTISSGFHFVDNHEVVQMNKDLVDSNGDLLQVISTWVKNDLGGRFRPMYMIDNVIVYTTFRGDFFLISIFHSLLHVFITFFLFLSVRKLGFRIFESLIFPLIALVGVQSVIWWRLGPNETIGMWYFSLTVIFMVYAIKSTKHKGLYRLFFNIFLAFMMLCKESFLLLTPAIIFAYLTLDKLESKDNTWIVILKKHIPELRLFLFLFVAYIIFILSNVNTENLGYAGIKGVDVYAYFVTFSKLSTEGGIGIISLIVFCTSCILSYFWSENRKKVLISHLFIFVFSILVILPQIFLYAKSGIFERYFVPGMIAWAIMLAFSLKNLHELAVAKYSKNWLFGFHGIEIALLILILVPRLVVVVKEAIQFTKDGKEINTVLSMITENVNSNSTILYVADPVTDFERTISFRRFLSGTAGLTKMYTYPLKPLHADAFEQSLINDFSWTMGGEEMHFDRLTDKRNVDLIVVFPLLTNKGDSIISSLGYNMNEFLSFRIGSYQLYFPNRNGQNPNPANFSANSLPGIPKNESVYNETAFFPEKSLNKGDSVQIIIHPSTEIIDPMVAYVILLDAAHPDNILVHQQIFGGGEIKISKLITTSIEKPWLIYRNWGKEQSIPSASISLNVKPNLLMFIPIQ